MFMGVLPAVMWLVVVVVFVGRGCAGGDGDGRGVDVVAVFSAPTQCLHSHIRWVSEGTAFTCRYSAQAATPLHQPH